MGTMAKLWLSLAKTAPAATDRCSLIYYRSTALAPRVHHHASQGSTFEVQHVACSNTRLPSARSEIVRAVRSVLGVHHIIHLHRPMTSNQKMEFSTSKRGVPLIFLRRHLTCFAGLLLQNSPSWLARLSRTVHLAIPDQVEPCT